MWPSADCSPPVVPDAGLCANNEMIDILVVDDHPAVRAGLVVLMRSEPGIVPVAAAGGVQDALKHAKRCRARVAVIDYDLDDGTGLELCYELKLLPHAPGVLIYTAFARNDLLLAARAAAADGLVEKGARPEELFAAIRSIASGRLVPLPVTPKQMVAGSRRLESEDLPILGMLLERESPASIAETLGVGASEVRGRVRKILGALAATAVPRRPKR